MKHPIADSPAITLQRGEPLACYHSWRESHDEGLLVVEFSLEQYWLEGQSALELSALYCVDGGSLRVSVTDRVLIADGSPGIVQYQGWIALHGLIDVDPGSQLELLPQKVPKPWGHEIWYSAVEQRCVCQFSTGSASVPIPWLQAVLPGASAGGHREALILLKLLCPAPQPVTGELYFELHQHKREIYVVTQVDPRAWPDEVGYIRYGFDEAKLAGYATESGFRAAYLTAVRAYETVRRSLDALPPAGNPSAQQLAREQVLRDEMNSFTALRPLRVGDVIEVPLMLPHSLLHGVRVIEFQTPTYERKILSFAQQVLTQDHWDTVEVIDQMCLTPPEPRTFPPQCPAPGIKIETIAVLDDFEVSRLRIEAGHSWEPDTTETHILLVVVSGVLRLAKASYDAEQALLLPCHWAAKLSCEETAQPLVLLLAAPRS